MIFKESARLGVLGSEADLSKITLKISLTTHSKLEEGTDEYHDEAPPYAEAMFKATRAKIPKVFI